MLKFSSSTTNKLDQNSQSHSTNRKDSTSVIGSEISHINSKKRKIVDGQYIPRLKINYKYTKPPQQTEDKNAYKGDQKQKIDNLMQYLQVQKKEYKEHQQLVRDNTTKQRQKQKRYEEIKFSGGAPKHQVEFKKHVHNDPTFSKQTFLLPSKEKSKKIQQEQEREKLQEKKLNQLLAPWNPINQKPKLFDDTRSFLNNYTVNNSSPNMNKTFNTNFYNGNQNNTKINTQNNTFYNNHNNSNQNQINIQNQKNILNFNKSSRSQSQQQQRIGSANSNRSKISIANKLSRPVTQHQSSNQRLASPSQKGKSFYSYGNTVNNLTNMNNSTKVTDEYYNNPNNNNSKNQGWRHFNHVKQVFEEYPKDNYHIKVNGYQPRVKTAFKPGRSKVGYFGEYKSLNGKPTQNLDKVQLNPSDFAQLKCNDFDLQF